MSEFGMTDLDYQREVLDAIRSYREQRAAGASADGALTGLYARSLIAGTAASDFEGMVRGGLDEQTAIDRTVAKVLGRFDDGFLSGDVPGPARWEGPRAQVADPPRPAELNSAVTAAVADFHRRRADGQSYAEALAGVGGSAPVRRAVREFDRLLTSTGVSVEEAGSRVALEAVAESALDHYVSLRQRGRSHDAALRYAADDHSVSTGAVNRFARRMERGVPVGNAYVDAIADTVYLATVNAPGPVVAAREGTPAERAEPAGEAHRSVRTSPVTGTEASELERTRAAVGGLGFDQITRAGLARVGVTADQYARLIASTGGNVDDGVSDVWGSWIGEPDVNDADWSAPAPRPDIPERAPTPGSWIARNLPSPAETSDFAKAREAVSSLGDGEITPEVLARVGVTPEQFADLVEADDRRFDEYVEQHRAQTRSERDQLAAVMSLEQARSIALRAEELDQHAATCNLDVGQCGTCSGLENDSNPFWELEVPAARQRLAHLDTEAALGLAADAAERHTERSSGAAAEQVSAALERRPEPNARNLSGQPPEGVANDGQPESPRYERDESDRLQDWIEAQDEEATRNDHRPTTSGGTGNRPADVIDRIDAVLAEENAATPAERGRAVALAESAMQQVVADQSGGVGDAEELHALHSIPARFLMSGDRFAWQDEMFTADDTPCPSDIEGHVVVNILTEYDNAWVDVPTDAWVSLHHDDLTAGDQRGVDESQDEDFIGEPRVDSHVEPSQPSIVDTALARQGAVGTTQDDAGQLGEQIDQCGRAVDAAEAAVRDAEVEQEDSERAERCARWNADEAAIERGDATAELWEQP